MFLGSLVPRFAALGIISADLLTGKARRGRWPIGVEDRFSFFDVGVAWSWHCILNLLIDPALWARR